MLLRLTVPRIAALVVLILLALVFSASVPTVSAQDRAGIGIVPAVIEPPNRLQPGETLVRTVEVRNLQNQDRVLYVIPRNIVGFNNGNTPIFADARPDSDGLEMTDWISVSEDVLNLAPNGSQTITLTIDIPENAPPGSHFGSLYISAEAPRLRESGAGIAYGVANIITFIVDGETETRASIRSFATDKFIYDSKDVSFSIRVENTGNVLVQPVGMVEVTNMFGAEVAQIDVNQETRQRVVPFNERTFRVNWSESNPGFGRYEALVSLAYQSDGGTRTMSSTVSFWILPLNIILPAAGTLVVLLLAVYIGVKLYVRRLLRMQGMVNRRLVRTRRKPNTIPVGLLLLIVMLTVTALFLIILLLLFA